MIRFKPRQTRIRGSTVLLVCLAFAMTAAVVTVIVASSARQTRWVGNIAITADQFVYLGDGKTYASGKVQLGDKLLLSGADDQVVFDSETLTGQGTLRLTDGNLDLFSGPFTASGKTGLAKPGPTASSKLSRIAGFAVARPASISYVNIPAATAGGTGDILITAPGVTKVSSVNFMLQPGALFQGAVPPMEFDLAGVILQIPEGAEMTDTGIFANKVTLQMPAELGGQTTVLTGFGITTEGLVLGTADGNVAVPDMWIGDGDYVKLSGMKGKLVYDVQANNYLFDLAGTLDVNLPDNMMSTQVSLELASDGYSAQLMGKVPGFALNVAGGTMQLGEVDITSYGLTAKTAQFALPAELGGASMAVTDVYIDGQGLSVGSGDFAIPDMMLADGLGISGAKAQVSVINGQYALAAQGTLNVVLPENTEATAIKFMMANDGTIAGEVNGLKLNLGGAVLELGAVKLGNDGLTSDSAMITVPPELGGMTAMVDQVTIGANGLSFGSAGFNIALPDMMLGEGLGLANNMAKLSVVESGQKFALDVNSTLVAGTDSEPITFAMTANPDGSVELNGSMGGLTLDLGGILFGLKNVVVTTEGLMAEAATLTMPAEMGGGVTTVSDVMIDGYGVSVGGGSFTLPDMTLVEGMVTLSGARADVTVADGQYVVGGQGTLNVVLPGNEEATAVTFKMGGDGQLSAQVSGLKLDVGGPVLALGTATVTNEGLKADSAMISMPAEMGGTSAMVDQVVIDANGLSFGNAGLNIILPEMPLGEGLAFTGGTAKLTVVNGAQGQTYALDVASALSIGETSESIKFTMSAAPDGSVAIAGAMSGLGIDIGGVVLGLNNVTISNDGLSAESATVAMPAEMGGGTTAVTNISITGEGLSVGGGSLVLPEIALADGAVTISNATADIAVVNGAYGFAVKGTLATNLPDMVQTTDVAFSIGADGQIQGSVSGLALNLGGVTLALGETKLSTEGLSAASAKIQVPFLFSAAVNDVSIGANGLSFGSGDLSVSLPDIMINSGFGFAGNKLSVSMGETGSVVTIDSTMIADNQQKPVRLTFNTAGGVEVAGTPSFSINLGGVTVTLSDMSMQN